MKIEYSANGANWVEGALESNGRGGEVVYQRDGKRILPKLAFMLTFAASYGGAILVVGCATYLLLTDDSAWMISLAVGAVILALNLASLNRRKQLESLARQEFGRELQDDMRCSMEMTPSQIVYEDSLHILENAWSEIARVVISPDRIIFVDAVGRVYVIPNSAFGVDTTKDQFAAELLRCLNSR